MALGQTQQVAAELRLLAQTGRHPNLVRLHGWFVVAPQNTAAPDCGTPCGAGPGSGALVLGPQPGCVCLVLERARGGTLDSAIKVRLARPPALISGAVWFCV